MHTTEIDTDVEIELARTEGRAAAAADILIDLAQFAPAAGDAERAGWLAAIEFIKTNY